MTKDELMALADAYAAERQRTNIYSSACDVARTALESALDKALAPVDDSDDLTIAYMAGFHAGKPAPVDAEPVAWAMRRADGLVLDVICPDEHESHEGEYTMPLYAHPAPLRELSDDELIALENAAAREVGNRRELTIAFARAVLKAAGGGV